MDIVPPPAGAGTTASVPSVTNTSADKLAEVVADMGFHQKDGDNAEGVPTCVLYHGAFFYSG